MEAKPKSFYNKERCERNKAEMLKEMLNRREKYKTQNDKDLENTQECKGTLLCILIRFFVCTYYYNVCVKWQREM
jgi:uncharacterized protein (UPF0305 family)